MFPMVTGGVFGGGTPRATDGTFRLGYPPDYGQPAEVLALVPQTWAYR
jgi:hypothetical protein